MGFFFSKPAPVQEVVVPTVTPVKTAAPATPAAPATTTTTTTTTSSPCTSNTIPAYVEDPTYHGHGGRVFVMDGVCVPSTWSIDSTVTPPSGKKAYYIPPEVMETMYLQNLYSWTP